MKANLKDDAPGATDQVRSIPKWVGRYAHNRDLPVFVVRMGLFLLACAFIGGSSKLAVRALQAGYKALCLALVVVSLAASIVWGWLVATRRLVPLIIALSGRLYGAEGTAVAATKPCGRSRAHRVVDIAFVLCVILSVAAGFAFEIPSRYMFPIFAAYGVPFLLYRWVRRGGMAVPFMLLWSGLMVIHAVLALAGVPPFNREPNALTILVPAVGYGVIAALASHVYSRIALSKLRSAARAPESDGTGD